VSDDDLRTRVFEAWGGYHALGNTVIDEPAARFISRSDVPRVHDANLVCQVRAASDEEIDDVLSRAEQLYNGLSHRKFALDPQTPSSFEARLVLEGYDPHPHLELVLEDDLNGSAPSAAEIRPVESDDDWRSLERLWRANHDEEAAKGQHDPWQPEVTAQMVAVLQSKAPDLQFWLAVADGEDCAFFSSWPGVNGLGIVEDLFTRPEFRGRGIATALIARAVADARQRGAGPIVIAARPNDTPKHMYAALGFRPCCVRTSYLKQ
jgi:GNAT superfamily N-acetyltransferase